MTVPVRNAKPQTMAVPFEIAANRTSLELASLDLANLDYAELPGSLSSGYVPETSHPKSARWWQRVFLGRSWIPPTDWILSFAIHAAILIALAFISLDATPGLIQSLMVMEVASEPLCEFESSENLSLSNLTSIELASDALDTPTDASLNQLELETPAFNSRNSTEGHWAPTDGKGSQEDERSGESMTAGRFGSAKLELLSRYGGTERTEAAVKLGLEWLRKQQTESGSWSYEGPYTQAARFGENRVAATSMALLAFLGAGHTHRTGPYQKQIHSGLESIIAQQKEDGNLGSGTPIHHAIYTHALGTLVLSEAYAMTRDSRLRQFVERGVRYTIRAQGEEGGWRYEFRGDSDTSVTGWCMMALVSAKSAGLEIPPANLRRIGVYLNSVDESEHDLYGYMKNRRPTPSMTAEGMLCRMYLGWSRSNPAIDKCTRWLLKNAPFETENANYYYWYYATQVMHHAGGDAWDQWNRAMREGLPAKQVREGGEAGSWETGGRGPDGTGGRLYATCLALYCLEVYYRHMPLYSAGK